MWPRSGRARIRRWLTKSPRWLPMCRRCWPKTACCFCGAITAWSVASTPADGKVHWRQRVGGNYSGSPIAIEDRLYCIAEDGTVVVLAAAARVPIDCPQSAGRKQPQHAGGGRRAIVLANGFAFDFVGRPLAAHLVLATRREHTYRPGAFLLHTLNAILNWTVVTLGLAGRCRPWPTIGRSGAARTGATFRRKRGR